MPRQRSPSRDKAYEIYINSKGKKKLIDIAAELGLKDSQIRKWKSEDKWDDKLKGALPIKNSNVTKKNKPVKKEPIVAEVTEIDDSELTEKQRLFCLYYIKSFNQTMAAIKAGYSPERAHVTGSELVRNSKVRDYIKQLKGKMTEELFIDAMDVLNRYIKIAFADMNDFVEFGQEEVPIMSAFGPVMDENGEPLTKMVNVIKFKDSNMVDGGLICQIKQGKDGASIKLEDRQKALDKLADYFDLFPDKFKRQIEEQKLEIAKIKAGNVEDEEVEDDGFIEALKGEVQEVWSDEDTE